MSSWGTIIVFGLLLLLSGAGTPCVVAQQTDTTRSLLVVDSVRTLADTTDLLMMMSPPVAKKMLDSFVYAEIDSAPKKKSLYIHDIPGLVYCTDTVAKKATFRATLKMGPIDYEFGRTTFYDTVEFKVRGLQGGTALFTHTDTLRIIVDTTLGKIRPEQTFIMDFTKDYAALDSIEVMVRTHWNGLGGNTLLQNNLRFEMSYSEDLRVSSHLEATDASPMVTLVDLGESVVDNIVTFAWELDPECGSDSFPNYQFQLLRMFNRDSAKAATGNPENILDTVDWSRALTIETESPRRSLDLTIAEGEGYYLWRVRPIGNFYPGGIADDRNWGAWSACPVDYSNFGIDGMDRSSYGSETSKSIFFYRQFDSTRNWIYSRTFSEGDSGVHISETMTYATELLQPVQTQAHLQSRQQIMVGQSVVDFNGRAALAALPAPVDQDGFGYQTGFIKNGSDLYTANNFDRDWNVRNPETIDAGPVADYYSDANSDLRVPSAGGYPFARTVFYPDGEQRMREMGGAGPDHRIGSTVIPAGATAKAYFSVPSDEELMAMFGDEAPRSETVQKTFTFDQNDVGTVSYVDLAGKTIATCMVRTTDSVGALESLSEGEYYNTTVHDTVRGNAPDGNHGVRSNKNITLPVATSVTLTYDLTPNSIEAACGSFCTSCDYIVEFLVYNAEYPDSALYYHAEEFHPDSCNPEDLPTITQTINLPRGTFSFERRIHSNTQRSDGTTYRQMHQDTIVARVFAGAASTLTTLNGYLDAANLVGFYHHLDSLVDSVHTATRGYVRIDTTSSTSDSILVYTLPIDCDSIRIPYYSCTKPDTCDTPLPSFEKMLYDRWGPGKYAYNGDTSKSFGADPTKYFRRNGGALYPNTTEFPNGKGGFDSLITHMMLDTSYHCIDLLREWTTLVSMYGVQATLHHDGNPDEIDENYDLLEVFLRTVGRTYKGISNCAYGNCQDTLLYGDTTGRYGKGYLDYAHQYFRYEYDYRYRDSLPLYISEVCEQRYLSGSQLLDWGNPTFEHPLPRYYGDGNPPWSPDGLRDSLQNKEWELFYRCFTDKLPAGAGNRLPQQCEGGVDIPCMLALRDSMEAICDSTCDRKYPAFRESIIRAYHDDGQTVEGDSTQPNGDAIDSLTTIVAMHTIECQAMSLVDHCKDDCSVPVYYHSIDSTQIDSIGSYQSQQTLYYAMYGSWKIGIPVGGVCSDSGAVLVPTVPSGHTYAALITRQLNDSLLRFRAAGNDTTRADTIAKWFQNYFKVLTGSDSCAWFDSTMSASANDTSCCPPTGLPDIFTLGPTITSYFAVEGCTLYLVRACHHDSVTVVQQEVLCTNICLDSCAPQICFAWRDLTTTDTNVILLPMTCEQETARKLQFTIHDQIASLAEQQSAEIGRVYDSACGGVETLHDLFRLDYEVDLYHFTLYYYDRAGHLVRTVPPAGVRLVSPPSRATVPSHVMVTTYEYNSLGQPIAKNTPDGGTTTFFYDAKQRLRFSQDARQAALYPQRYSYQQYDSLSRVVESGEAMEYTSMYVAVEDFRTLVDTMNYPVRGKTEWTKTTYTTQTGLHYLHDDTSTVRAQRHLRNRVSSRKTYQGVETVYSYDPHGNVAWVYQNLPGLGGNFIGYDYDLISNRVKQVLYDEQHGDQFYQRYGYDEDGRVTTVESSRDGVIWDRDAGYDYFLHGPLKRIELGEDRLQGLDYTHTIHGWLKAINHPALSIDTTLDPGHDNGMERTAPDVFGMILNFYEGDYLRSYNSGADQSPYNSKSVGSSTEQAYQLTSRNLYNGNISGWSLRTTPVGMPSIPAGQTAPALSTHESLVGYSFRYDVLNRLRTSSFSYYSQGSSSAWNYMGTADYYMSLAYDPNGNIDSMTRHGYAKPGGNVAMDKLTYSYPTTPGAENNRLRHVKDSESSGSYANDIDDEPDDNYLYDPSGNLIYDQSDGTLIRWNAQGKVIQVRKITATVKKDLIYIYDAAGERIAKKELDYLAAMDSSWVTYYVRDAGEKVIAVYRQKLHYSDTSDTCPPGVPGSGMDTDADGIDETPPNFCDNCNSTITPTLPPEFTYRNPWQEDYDNDGIGDACDPCPFGPGDECGTPLSDTAVVRASKWIPSGFAVLAEWHIYGSSVQGRVGIWKPEKNRDTSLVADTIFTRILTLKEYELKDHLGNVTVVISDLKTASTGGGAPYPFGVDVKSFSHYYPFGMLQPGAFGSNREYRFGYNGKESDNDWKGEGNVYDYGFRVYDPRIAKFLSVDPLAPEYPGMSPYCALGNNPISNIDPDGRDVVYFGQGGVEIYRIKSNTVFKTLIKSNEKASDPRISSNGWVEVPMPKIIKQRVQSGETTTNVKYQEYDYLIAARVGYFNQDKNSGRLQLYTERGDEIPQTAIRLIPNLDPTLVKAIAIQESHLNFSGKTEDIMQVNVAGDYTDMKAAYGMSRGEKLDPSNSLFYGIRILATKGFKGGIDYQPKTGKRTFEFKGWESATGAYNGKGIKDYEKFVIEMHKDADTPTCSDYTDQCR